MTASTDERLQCAGYVWLQWLRQGVALPVKLAMHGIGQIVPTTEGADNRVRVIAGYVWLHWLCQGASLPAKLVVQAAAATALFHLAASGELFDVKSHDADAQAHVACSVEDRLSGQLFVLQLFVDHSDETGITSCTVRLLNSVSS